ncbi:MAG: CBS domain-containing protein [Candidatus Aenigmarchaeota archaeon]|nr:CBS domain-containing protein [Candidatus Aenigmarchaeota archaeon]
MITGEMIKKMRIEAGISQTELAKLAGVSQAHVAKIENSRVDPRLSTVNRIMFVLSKNKRAILCGEIMNDHIIPARPDDPLPKIIAVMKSSGISQMPVMKGKTQTGSIREHTLIHNVHRNLRTLKVRDIMDKPFPTVNVNDPIEILTQLLDFHPAILVEENGNTRGIITKSDLLEVK